MTQQPDDRHTASRALVIDDVRAARAVLVDMLSELGLQNCLQAASGREALGILKQESVDLIFCDFMMFEMDGPQFLVELAQIKLMRSPQVIFVSSLSDEQSMREVSALGVNHYIVKPVNFKELRNVVGGALGAPPVLV